MCADCTHVHVCKYLEQTLLAASDMDDMGKSMHLTFRVSVVKCNLKDLESAGGYLSPTPDVRCAVTSSPSLSEGKPVSVHLSGRVSGQARTQALRYFLTYVFGEFITSQTDKLSDSLKLNKFSKRRPGSKEPDIINRKG